MSRSEESVQSYRQALVKAGIGVKITSQTENMLRKIASVSKDNPASVVHGLAVEDALLCGLFESRSQRLLVLPPYGSVIEVVADFLRFEAMRHKASGASLRALANKIEKRGRKLGIIRSLKFRKGTTKILDNKGKILVAKASVIGDWAVHESAFGRKGFSVTLRPAGMAVEGGFDKKTAKSVAKNLAELGYPWRLIRKVKDLDAPEWREATKAVMALLDDVVDGKAENPGRSTASRRGGGSPRYQVTIFGR